MAKGFKKSPTLLQTLLNRPSQSYTFPQVDKTEYYSAKNDMIRVALEVEAESLRINSGRSSPYEDGLKAATPRRTPSNSVDDNHSRIESNWPPARQHTRSASAPGPTLADIQNQSTDEDSDSDDDVFYTPNTSPRVSMASTNSVISNPPSPRTETPTRKPGSRSVSSSSASTVSVSSMFSSFASSSGSTSRTTPEPSVHSSSRRQGKKKETDPLEEDWAKEVRRLIQPPSTATETKERQSPTISRPYRSRSTSRRGSQIQHHSIMSALIEEDEEPTTSVSRSNSKRKTSSSGSTPKRRSSTRSNTNSASTSAPPARPSLPRRKSRSLDDIPHANQDLVSNSSTPSSSYSAPPTTTPSLPSYGTPGYTSLTLPRAPPPSSGLLEKGKKGKIDLTRSGLAQTTMASIEVTRGLSSSSKRFAWLHKNKGSGKGKEREDSVFSFTSYRKPPTQVPEGHALIQVWAVGVDGVDARLCGLSRDAADIPNQSRRSQSESDAGAKRSWSLRRNGSVSHSPVKLRQPEVGFIPGRSLVGRVIEVGDEDDPTRNMKKGEWVIGLLDVRKSGALQEFVVVERHRLHPVPHPALPPSALSDLSSPSFSSPASPSLTSLSLPSPEHTQAHTPNDSRYPLYSPTPTQSGPETPQTPSRTHLTLEELALLPSCGVQAYRAVKTFVHPGRKSKGRVLVIHGHDGVGAMATQMLVRRGWSVCVHAAVSTRAANEQEEMRSIQARVTGWGADEVIFESEPDTTTTTNDSGVVDSLRQLITEGEAFDGILDTVGGKEVWEAGRKLLSVGQDTDSDIFKQFTTLVGDFPTRPIPSASDHLKTSLRSMKGGNGNVAYSWCSIDQDVDFEGTDVATGIARVLSECTGVGQLGPFVGDDRVVTFERAHDVFRRDGGLEDGGTVVVRVVL